MALPTSSTPGYTSYVGRVEDGRLKRHVCCICTAAWLPVLHQYLIFKKLLPSTEKYLWIEQLTGGEEESAGTHSQGGAIDLGYSTRGIALAMREMGAPATWVRLRPRFSIDHIHSVLSGCIHNYPARYQITEQRNGGDGLIGTLPDPLPDPEVYRDWRQGIAFAKGQMSSTGFLLRELKYQNFDPEVAKFQKFMWSKQPESYKVMFRSKYYNFDTKGYTQYYGSATAKMVEDTYKRLHGMYPTAGWNYGVVNNVWPDEPGPGFIKHFGGYTYI